MQNGVADDHGAGLYFTYSIDHGNGDVTVSLDIIRRNHAMFAGGLAAAAHGSGVLRVKNDLFESNVADVDAGAAELFTYDDAQLYVTGDTVVGNIGLGQFSTGGLYVHQDGASPAVLSDNIFWANSVVDLQNDSAIMLHDDCGSSVYAPPDGSTGNLGVDPQFVFATDFHLRASSPLIDAGVDDPPDGVTDTDLDGNPRVHGHVDIGAYERGDAIYADGFE